MSVLADRTIGRSRALGLTAISLGFLMITLDATIVNVALGPIGADLGGALSTAQWIVNFYNVDVLGPERISEQAWQASFNVAAGSSPHATYACVDTWLTDFREDLPNIDVPTLVVHGTDDRILPFAATAARLGELIADVTIVPVEGGPHNIGWTHPTRSMERFSASSPTPQLPCHPPSNTRSEATSWSS